MNTHTDFLENDPEYINLQIELVRMQDWIIKNNKRLLIIFEGRDSAGKGGAIMRFIRYINPRFYRVVALGKPSEVERGQWYFQRYLSHLPDPGEIAFFDRSWYNRAVVEPVMGFCTEAQHNLFMKQVTQVEKMLIEDGCMLIKFWFSIDKEEQNNRLDERRTNPLISWKLSTVDMQAQQKWNDYTAKLNLHNKSLSSITREKNKLTTKEEKELLQTAFDYFNNDSFWLVAPFKVFDKGTKREIVTLENGKEALLVSYTIGGSTPGDSYLWVLQPNGIPKSYKMWVSIIPVGGIKASWENWKMMKSGILLSTEHKLGPITLYMGTIKAY